MGTLCNSLRLALLLISIAVEGTKADVVVSGSVFCDQCKDGRRSFFDYPLNGVKVALACAEGGVEKVLMQETTNGVGTYSMRFKEGPDMRRCFARVVESPQGNWCAASAGPARSLSPSVSMFGVSFYTVDSLLLQPARPMSFCPKSVNPRPALPAMPPLPFLQPSACPYRSWLMPQNRCNWRVVGPQTKVALAFGLAAAQKYGTDMTLLQGLLGRGDLYRTLLREATTALLNSYNSVEFEYPTLRVLWDLNQSLQGNAQASHQAGAEVQQGQRWLTQRHLPLGFLPLMGPTLWGPAHIRSLSSIFTYICELYYVRWSGSLYERVEYNELLIRFDMALEFALCLHIYMCTSLYMRLPAWSGLCTKDWN